MDMSTLPLEDTEMVYFELSSISTSLNCHTILGDGSPLTLQEKEADWPIGTPMLRGPPTIIAPAAERGCGYMHIYVYTEIQAQIS